MTGELGLVGGLGVGLLSNARLSVWCLLLRKGFSPKPLATPRDVGTYVWRAHCACLVGCLVDCDCDDHVGRMTWPTSFLSAFRVLGRWASLLNKASSLKGVERWGWWCRWGGPWSHVFHLGSNSLDDMKVGSFLTRPQACNVGGGKLGALCKRSVGKFVLFLKGRAIHVWCVGGRGKGGRGIRIRSNIQWHECTH